MKMNKSGKLLSVIFVLMLMVSLVMAMAITSSADANEAENPVTEDSSFFDLAKTTTYFERCGKVRVVWNDVSDADMYIVYLDGIHKGYTIVNYYNFIFETVDYDQDLIYHTVRIDAVKDDTVIASGAIEIAPEHKYTPKVTPPNCVDKGYTENICTCGYAYIIEDSYVDALGHDMLVANCTEPDRCQRPGCGYTVGEPLGHIWDEWTSNGDDTHTRRCHRYEELPEDQWHTETNDCNGGLGTCLERAVCRDCHSEYGIIEADSHAGVREWSTLTKDTHASTYNCCGVVAIPEESHEWVDGVCSECGYVCVHEGGTATCVDLAVCDHCHSEYGELAPDNHTETWTWTDRGDVHTAQYTCCNAIYLSAAHQWQADENEVVVCIVCGIHQHEHSGGVASCDNRATCELCGLKYGYVDPTNHSGSLVWTKNDMYHEARWSCCGVVNVITEFHNWKDGNCTTCGYSCVHEAAEDDGNCTTAVLCTKCGCVLEAAEAEHVPGEDDGDCTTALHCANCEVIVTPARGAHDGSEATCTQGNKCKYCGTIYGNPLGHEWKNPNGEVIAPTCENDGYRLFTCVRCGAQTSKDIVPAYGHDMTVKVEGVAPTCTSDGYETYYKCSTCGYYKKIVVLPALPHNLSTVEAPYDENTFFIHKHQLCADCGYSQNLEFDRVNFKCKTITTVLIILVVTIAVIAIAIIGIYAAAPTTTPGRVVFKVILTVLIGAGVIVLGYLALSVLGQTFYNMFGPNLN